MNLSDRIKKNYENRYRVYLTRRTPVIIRADGKTFHTLTSQCSKPFDKVFANAMIYTGSMTSINIQSYLGMNSVFPTCVGQLKKQKTSINKVGYSKKPAKNSNLFI